MCPIQRDSPSLHSVEAAEELSRRPALEPPRGLSVKEREEFERLAQEHRLRLHPDDSYALADLVRIRLIARDLWDQLFAEGATITSPTGVIKPNPLFTALRGLRSQERHLVALLGLQRPSPALARQTEVARKREELAKFMAEVDAGPGGYLLA